MPFTIHPNQKPSEPESRYIERRPYGFNLEIHLLEQRAVRAQANTDAAIAEIKKTGAN